MTRCFVLATIFIMNIVVSELVMTLSRSRHVIGFQIEVHWSFNFRLLWTASTSKFDWELSRGWESGLTEVVCQQCGEFPEIEAVLIGEAKVLENGGAILVWYLIFNGVGTVFDNPGCTECLQVAMESTTYGITPTFDVGRKMWYHHHMYAISLGSAAACIPIGSSRRAAVYEFDLSFDARSTGAAPSRWTRVTVNSKVLSLRLWTMATLPSKQGPQHQTGKNRVLGPNHTVTAILGVPIEG
ncbi:hypothetical protein BDN72DRAFT_857222 [Pluteus cervinus]|uniref:Uncharacterized protein n=1 Tax=Pluteus cervinus TaxID=181527 RepID=A0ACD3AXK9_9AGAR|nr:hypothetical protein BDN72DRAFT_857222 [Pluteus cervinus]